MNMKKITGFIILILIIIIAFITYLLINNPKNESIYINIPLGESKKINNLNENYSFDNDVIEIDENNNIWGIKKGETILKSDDKKYNIKVVDPVKDINYKYDEIELGIGHLSLTLVVHK